MIAYKSLSNVIMTACNFRRSRYGLRQGSGGCGVFRVCKEAIICISLIVLNALLFMGCNQKDLLFPDELCKAEIHFNWDKAPEAYPEGMTLLFYPLDSGGEFWRFEISGRDGGAVELPWGNYTLIALNNDLPGVMLKDMPYSSASLSVREMPQSRYYASPVGMVYEGKIDNLKIMPGEGSNVIECRLDSMSTEYNVIIEDISGIERVKSVQAVFEGCSEGIFLSTLEPLSSTVTTQLFLETDYEHSTFKGSTTGFPSAATTAAYVLTLRVAYFDGGVYEKSFDVTRRVINSLYPHHVYIIIKGLDLPEEPTIEPDEVGMKVDVDGWKVIEIDLDSTNY